MTRQTHVYGCATFSSAPPNPIYVDVRYAHSPSSNQDDEYQDISAQPAWEAYAAYVAHASPHPTSPVSDPGPSPYRGATSWGRNLRQENVDSPDGRQTPFAGPYNPPPCTRRKSQTQRSRSYDNHHSSTGWVPPLGTYDVPDPDINTQRPPTRRRHTSNAEEYGREDARRDGKHRSNTANSSSHRSGTKTQPNDSRRHSHSDAPYQQASSHRGTSRNNARDPEFGASTKPSHSASPHASPNTKSRSSSGNYLRRESHAPSGDSATPQRSPVYKVPPITYFNDRIQPYDITKRYDQTSSRSYLQILSKILCDISQATNINGFDLNAAHRSAVAKLCNDLGKFIKDLSDPTKSVDMLERGYLVVVKKDGDGNSVEVPVDLNTWDEESGDQLTACKILNNVHDVLLVHKRRLEGRDRVERLKEDVVEALTAVQHVVKMRFVRKVGDTKGYPMPDYGHGR
ncbi:Protein of unknown function [Pyronema omphalodes CBS 100304]|uniref:Uncharacterized protein n=1 Tax=Pyronema omphalodes (strain CBS 100304) TaxID=1076935 RepID=U4KU33_PYROM|nr:Protein of unknown function [Pyronema omphalodes CBS 100304]